MSWAWWILFSPFIGFLLTPFISERNRALAGWIALAGIVISLGLTLKLALPLFESGHFHHHELSIGWIALSKLSFEFGLLIDHLSIMMLVVVTGVGSTIFYYSMEYMSHDKGFRRYFAGLSLFAFSMIGIVLSNNLLQLFIFWELVGFSSYLLIGHWFEKCEAADAGKKAFLTNRVADFGFLIGILMLWSLSGSEDGVGRTLNLIQLNEGLPHLAAQGLLGSSQITIAMLLIFMGVMGKSAQFPLHVWLPDAMEGPTPVSALIHAATMVAAGVYLLARMFALFALSPLSLSVVSIIGGVTALIAATQALIQSDLKRILAYSTLSQLGYMVMAIGLGSVSAGMYHLTTHAFFKALLFLAAGSVIHATHTQNIFEMGGLTRKLPLTSATFMIGSFALAGFWPLSGFFSKDEILLVAFSQNKILFSIAVGTVFLTAFYMTRAVSIAFLGTSKAEGNVHEPSEKMLFPLIILSLLSAVAGFFGLEKLFHHPLEHEIVKSSFVVVLATMLAIFGVLSAFWFYSLPQKRRTEIATPLSWLHKLISRKYYMDDLYDWILTHIQAPIASFFDMFERVVIVKGAVNGTAEWTQWLGKTLRRAQTGKVETYLTLFASGVAVMLYFVLIRNLV